MASACSVGSAVQIYVGLSVELIKTSQRGTRVRVCEVGLLSQSYPGYFLGNQFMFRSLI